MKNRFAVAFMVGLMPASLASEEIITADTCKPQPSCRINYPSVKPGASPQVSIMGGNNSVIGGPNTILGNPGGIVNNIQRDPANSINPHTTGQKKICIPWC